MSRAEIIRRGVSAVCGVAAVVYFSSFALSISASPSGKWNPSKHWTLKPDKEHTVPFNDHGRTVFVTESDSWRINQVWSVGTVAFFVFFGSVVYLQRVSKPKM